MIQNHDDRGNEAAVLPGDEDWMRVALDEARQAAELGEVPVGAVLVRDGVLLASGCNQPILQHDPTAHAEIVTLRRAGQKVGNYRLPGTTLYVTLEPCAMCVGALVHARVTRLVFGAREPKAGAVCSSATLLDSHRFNWRIGWTDGVLAAECGELVSAFFSARRRQRRVAADQPPDTSTVVPPVAGTDAECREPTATGRGGGAVAAIQPKPTGPIQDTQVDAT